MKVLCLHFETSWMECRCTNRSQSVYKALNTVDNLTSKQVSVGGMRDTTPLID